MTDVLDPSAIDVPEGASLPYDFFREVHKGLRLAMFRTTAVAGAASYDDATARSEVVERVHGLLGLLHAHHAHEDGFIKPLLDACDRQLSGSVDAGHEQTDADMAMIEQLAADLLATDGEDAVVRGFVLYRHLAAFAARYLGHMALEEDEVMPALRGALSVDELFDVDMQLRGAVPPPTMCAFISVMTPAMNTEERVSMLGGMQAGAPPEIFELFRNAAEAALDAADYRSVATRLGLA
ncbi:MAG: hypothetical protein JWO68_4216 [Actinomycetia bacterium]|nr:hypothetical protein [Actinomycetes bacterium]